MSSSKSSDQTNHQASDNSNTETVSGELPPAGNSKRKTAAIAGTTSLGAAAFAAAVTYFLSGGTLTATPPPCAHSHVVQESTLTFDATTGRRSRSLQGAQPPPGSLKLHDDKRDALQKSIDEYNALTRWKSQNNIDYAAGMPRDSAAPAAPSRRRAPDDTLRERQLDRSGSRLSRGHRHDDSDDSTGRSQRLLRRLGPSDKLHRGESRLFRRK